MASYVTGYGSSSLYNRGAPAGQQLTGTPYSNGGAKGTIYDLAAFAKERAKLSDGDTLKLFHHTAKQWAEPGVRTRISTRKSDGVYGKGFYTSTKPEKGYGHYEFQLFIPVSKLAGKKVFEVTSGFVPKNFEMPPGCDVMAVKAFAATWFIFKPGSEWWVQGVSTESDFDRPGEPAGV
jgi:hypothetical protein